MRSELPITTVAVGGEHRSNDDDPPRGLTDTSYEVPGFKPRRRYRPASSVVVSSMGASAATAVTTTPAWGRPFKEVTDPKQLNATRFATNVVAWSPPSSTSTVWDGGENVYS